MNLADLKKPFLPAKISWRVGSTNAEKTKGMALAYIDARDVQDRLDEVCGIEGWQNRYIPMHDKKTVCEIGIYIQPALFREQEGVWIWKSDGAGDSDIEAEKGALSDAFKRAAVRWGIGRYLYDLDSPWVALEAAGRSYKIAAHEYPRLEALLSKSDKSPPVRYGDEDGQAKDWADRQVTLIKGRMTLPAIYEWLESKCGPGGTISDPNTGSDIDKLKKKSPELYGALVQAFQAQLVIINRKQ